MGGRERRTGLTVIVSVVVSVGFVAVLSSRWDELAAGITGAPLLIVAAAVALQVVALLTRTEAWQVCVRASGGTVDRRRFYRASSMGCVGNLLNAQLGAAARIAALRRSAPDDSPRVPALVAAELPILVVEAALAALASFTLVGPLGLPWWLPLVCVAVVTAVGAGVRRVAAARQRWLAKGLAVMRSRRGRNRMVAFVFVAVLAQVARNWLLLHAVGLDASLFDAIAVLIAVVSLGQLPFGLSVGAAATVLILGPEGVTAAAAAGVLLTATGTAGGLAFAGWAALDLLASDQRVRAFIGSLRPADRPPWLALGALPAQRRRVIESAYFGGLSHLQIAHVLGVALPFSPSSQPA